VKSIISKLTVAILALGLAGLAGCSKSADEPVAAASDNPALAAPVPAGMVRGTVLETMNSGGYTYVFMDTGQDQRWVAAMETAVQVGDVVQTAQGMPMQGFTSKTLNRTFNVVYFVDALQNLSASVQGQPLGAMPDSHPPVPLPEGHPGPDGPTEAAAADTQVAALESGQDIAYVYANKDELVGQQVSLRGKVVKYNDGILGWNFIHVQDGSGDAADGSNDLTVTSKATTAVGETVVLTGTIILDKDFGAGYSFPVLMEDASIAPE
jgi:hypothetical protein